MKAFYEAFSIGIAIFACILFLITMGKAVAGISRCGSGSRLLPVRSCYLRFASRCMRTHFENNTERARPSGRVLHFTEIYT